MSRSSAHIEYDSRERLLKLTKEAATACISTNSIIEDRSLVLSPWNWNNVTIQICQFRNIYVC